MGELEALAALQDVADIYQLQRLPMRIVCVRTVDFNDANDMHHRAWLAQLEKHREEVMIKQLAAFSVPRGHMSARTVDFDDLDISPDGPADVFGSCYVEFFARRKSRSPRSRPRWPDGN